jgi:hypothetical protein
MTLQLERPTHPPIQVDDLVERLVRHPLYARVRDEATLRRFMASHVFCVWDFQSLLKALQRRLTCVEVPWVPTADPESRRLINEIVLDEESDETPDGGYLSHFELYLRAMEACGADTGPVLAFTAALRGGQAANQALAEVALPPGVATFVAHTLAIASSDDVHRIAAAFTYGREDVIPAMFQQLVRTLAARQGASWDVFLFYLNRHIEHDGEHHGPMSRRLVARLCGDKEGLWREAEETARGSLEARLELWDHIADGL